MAICIVFEFLNHHLAVEQQTLALARPFEPRRSFVRHARLAHPSSMVNECGTYIMRRGEEEEEGEPIL